MSAHTPGPWEWRFPAGGLPELVCQRHGRLLVMDAVREGFNRATLRFAERDPSDRGGLMHKAAHFFASPAPRVPDIQVPNHPDMRLIATAPGLLAALREIEAHHAEQNAMKGRDESDSRTLRIARAAIAEAEGGA